MEQPDATELWNVGRIKKTSLYMGKKHTSWLHKPDNTKPFISTIPFNNDDSEDPHAYRL